MNDKDKMTGAGRPVDAVERLLAEMDMPVPTAEGLAERIIARAAREPRKEPVQAGFAARMRKALFGAPLPASPRGAWMRPAGGFALAAIAIMALSPVWMDRAGRLSEQPLVVDEIVAMAETQNGAAESETAGDLRSDFDLMILQDMEEVFL